MSQVPIVRQALQNAASATGNGTVVDLGGVSRDIGIYVIWSAGVSAGQVELETAFDVDYNGTWGPIATAFPSPNKMQLAQLPGAYRAIRARIAANGVGRAVAGRDDTT